MKEEYWKRYARLLVELAVDLRPGQPLYVHGQVAHRHLIALLIEVAYEAGSGPVSTRLFDPLQHAAILRHGRLEDIELFHSEIQTWYNEIVRLGAAYICLQGPEIPHLWEETARTHPERTAVYNRGHNVALSGFQRYGQQGRRCPWVAAPCPTEGWAREVFPELPGADAFNQLAELIFRFTYADREDAFEQAKARDRRLKARCRRLDALGITEMLVSGGGSQLKVGVSRGARWRGGSLKTATGQTYLPNMPSLEVYTTPDRRLTEGRLVVTRPLRLQRGRFVKDLVLRFQNGRVVDFDVSCGREALGRLLDSDDGARYLGEIALVGQDSAIAGSGLFFDLDLLDENAASHLALGQGYPWALDGGTSMSPSELEEAGCNPSSIHKDILFGSNEVSVVATKSLEGEVALVERGQWMERFVSE